MGVAEQLGGLLTYKGVAGDINQHVDMGWYSIQGTSSNSPNNYNYGILIVIGSKGPYLRLAQLVVAVNQKMFFRICETGSTGITEITKEWKEIQIVS